MGKGRLDLDLNLPIQPEEGPSIDLNEPAHMESIELRLGLDLNKIPSSSVHPAGSTSGEIQQQGELAVVKHPDVYVDLRWSQLTEAEKDIIRRSTHMQIELDEFYSALIVPLLSRQISPELIIRLSEVNVKFKSKEIGLHEFIQGIKNAAGEENFLKIHRQLDNLLKNP